MYSLTDEYQGPKSEFRRFVTASVVSVSNDQDIPTSYALGQNYPNPFNPSTKISYSIPINNRSETQEVKLTIYDVLGKEIAILVNKEQKAGYYETQFDASNLTSGVYFYRLQVGSFNESKKMILLK